MYLLLAPTDYSELMQVHSGSRRIEPNIMDASK